MNCVIKNTVLLLILSFLACKSKNRFESPNENQTKTSSNAPITNIKGSVTEVESDAIPFLNIQSDSPKWNLKLGLIQDELFDAKLEFNPDNKIYFGIMKRIIQPNQQGEFYVGELNSNNSKNTIQIYCQNLPCVDNQKKEHNARVTLLKDEKEYYACGDYLNK